jgi:sec-independent protein translocase protein TatC
VSLFRNILNKASTNPDGEMGFLDHIEVLRWHIVRSAVAVVICAIGIFIKVEWIFDKIILGPAHNDFISYKWFCALGKALHYDSFCLGEIKMEFQNTQVTGQFMMGMSTSMILGFVVAFPYVLWELWKFIKPALKPNEVRSARGMVFWCSLLFFVGVVFAYFILVPYTINFFGSYQLSPSFKNIITIDNYYDTVTRLVLALGIVFELPIIIYFLSRVGIITPAFMKKQRRYAVLILFLVSEIITPPDLFSCLLVFIPLYALYEVSVVISARVERKKIANQNQD